MRRQTYKSNAEYIEAMMKRFKLVDMREQYRCCGRPLTSAGYHGCVSLI